MADRLQRRRRRRKRVRWLAVMAERRRRDVWSWSAVWASLPPPKHGIAIYDTWSPTNGS